MKRVGYGLTPRDIDIIRTVSRLGRAHSNHIYELCFTSSRPTMYTVLDRLVKHEYLRKGERRYGDIYGNPGQFVYAPGRAGWHTINPDRPFKSGPVLNRTTLHTLTMADCYVDIWRAGRAGDLTVNDMRIESEAYRTYAHIELQPDLFVDVTSPGGNRYRMFVEVDMGSERRRDIVGKFERYWHAYETTWPKAGQTVTEHFPVPVLVVPDAMPWRIAELKQWVAQWHKKHQLWHVVAQSEFASSLSR